jgi:hypothetical protein
MDDALKQRALADIDRVLAYSPGYGGKGAVIEVATSYKACILRWSTPGSPHHKMAEEIKFQAPWSELEQHARALMATFRRDVAAGQVTLLDDGVRALQENVIMPDVPDKKKVFIIHGRCEPAKHEMGVFLRSLGLEPVWFRDVRKNMGGTVQIIRVVEQGMKEAHGVLALVTPDEFSVLRPPMRKPGEGGEAVERWQARPNVLFEAGMAYMRDPDRVAFVLFGEAKLFTDTAGMCVFWPTNDHGPDSHRTQLRDLLGGGMHCDINDGHDWMTSGDFDAVIRGLSGVSPRSPFP